MSLRPMIIRRVGVFSVAKVAGVCYATMGLIGGLFFAAISMVSAGFSAAAQNQGANLPAWFGAVFGVGAIVFFPILYGVIGFVFGALSAAIYNLFAGLVGGIELDVTG